MASRAPSTREAHPGPLYERDFAAWTTEQAARLRAGQVAQLDAANIAEELEGLTKRDERALGSQLRRIMLHLLKLRFQPELATRSWNASIRDGRAEVSDILEQSPSLRAKLPGLLTKNYPRAVADAIDETGLSAATFPPRPPFDLSEILSG